MKFQLIKTKMLKFKDLSFFQTLRFCTYTCTILLYVNITKSVGILSFISGIRVMLIEVEHEKFYNLGA